MNDFEDWQPFFQGLWDSSLGNWTESQQLSSFAVQITIWYSIIGPMNLFNAYLKLWFKKVAISFIQCCGSCKVTSISISTSWFSIWVEIGSLEQCFWKPYVLPQNINHRIRSILLRLPRLWSFVSFFFVRHPFSKMCEMAMSLNWFGPASSIDHHICLIMHCWIPNPHDCGA